MAATASAEGVTSAGKHHTDGRKVAPQEDLLVTNVEKEDTGTEYAKWTVTLNIEGSPVDFKIDTGADCSTMSETMYKTLQKRRGQQKPKKVLSGPGGGLNCLGQFITQTS